MATITTAGRGRAICEALGLDAERTATILITFEPGDIVRIQATLFPTAEQLQALGKVFET